MEKNIKEKKIILDDKGESEHNQNSNIDTEFDTYDLNIHIPKMSRFSENIKIYESHGDNYVCDETCGNEDKKKSVINNKKRKQTSLSKGILIILAFFMIICMLMPLIASISGKDNSKKADRDENVMGQDHSGILNVGNNDIETEFKEHEGKKDETESNKDENRGEVQKDDVYEEYVIMPFVEGCEKNYAINKLKKLGLNVECSEYQSEDIPKDYVFYQSYAEGDKVKKGEIVSLYISRGKVYKENSGELKNEVIFTINSRNFDIKDIEEWITYADVNDSKHEFEKLIDIFGEPKYRGDFEMMYNGEMNGVKGEFAFAIYDCCVCYWRVENGEGYKEIVLLCDEYMEKTEWYDEKTPSYYYGMLIAQLRKGDYSTYDDIPDEGYEWEIGWWGTGY